MPPGVITEVIILVPFYVYFVEVTSNWSWASISEICVVDKLESLTHLW